MKPLALIGYRATGKTTVGQLVAEQLCWTCIDTDAEIVARAGCTIAEIFASKGEAAFRDLESQVVEDVTQRTNVVLSFGGGVILRSENREKIIGRCVPVVWLQASVDAIYQRIHGDAASATQRPNLTSQGGRQEIEQVLQQRWKLYEACATMMLDTESHSPEQLAQLIYQLVKDNR